MMSSNVLLRAATERPEETALIDGDSGERWTYRELTVRARQEYERIPGSEKELGFCVMEPTPLRVAQYLGALMSGHVVALIDPETSRDRIHRLIDLYQPGFIFGGSGVASGYSLSSKASSLWLRSQRSSRAIHPDVGVLLTTSGSTGSPKFVRLSRDNVYANAAAIVEYLGIRAADRAVGSLPFSYSYGLSVLNSHLLAGASIALTRAAVLEKEFWTVVSQYECTSFAGVPQTYEMLDRLRLLDMGLPPTLRCLTQAGGRLQPRLVKKLAGLMASRGGKFWVMYGQTEATARIAYLPPEKAASNPGSIGIPIPGGRIEIRNDAGETLHQPGETGELVYFGPNVMLGYATGPEDLEKGDCLAGALRTGDLGYRDADGLLHLTGRTKRITKLLGRRINLDEVEADAREKWSCQAAVIGDDDGMCICFVGPPDAGEIELRRRYLADAYHINTRLLDVCFIDQFPLTGRGKIDYAELERRFSRRVGDDSSAAEGK